MHWKSNINGLKGSVTIYNRVLRLRGMDIEEIERRIKIINFEKEYGVKAAKEAFNVSDRTIRRWKEILKEGNGYIHNLSPKSRKPKTFRQSKVTQVVKDEILNQRKQPGILGPEKIHKILTKKFKLEIVPPAKTIERIIHEFKQKGLLPWRRKLSLNGKTGKLHERPRKKRKKQRKPKGKRAFHADSISRFFCGIKLRIITGIDSHSKKAFAKGFLNLSSKQSKEFIEECIKQIKISDVQTDNGLEFEKYFHQTLEKHNINHYYSYPRCPKQNAFIERFNRTLSEDFLEKEKFSALVSIELFNQKLQTYMDWYNKERPHASLNYLTPNEYLLELEETDICV